MGPFADSELQFYARNVLKLNLKQLGEKLKQQMQLKKEIKHTYSNFAKMVSESCKNCSTLSQSSKACNLCTNFVSNA